MKRRNKLLALLLTLVMVLGLLPTTAFAATAPEEPPAEVVLNGDGVRISKSVTANADGSYQITMEAYVTGTIQPTEPKPLDIVLVLDQSGSMAYNFAYNSTRDNTSRRQYAMKQAVNNFIDAVGENSSNHRIALVTFGTNAATLKGWTATDTTPEGAAALKSAIDGLPDAPSGATNVAAGMTEAQTLLNDTREGAQQIVIVFTDGVPTTGTDFNTTVADGALAAAEAMKTDGAAIYTVGIFNGAKASQLYGDKWEYLLYSDVPCTGNPGSCWGGSWAADLFGSANDFDVLDVPAANRFLNYLSTNFEDAAKIGITKGKYNPSDVAAGAGTGWKIDSNATSAGSGYYLTANDLDTLKGVFTEIAGNIVPGMEADATTVLSDTMTEYFVFAGADADDVTVQEASAFGTGDEPEWSAPTAFEADVSAAEGGITVTGFDYSGNAVVKDDSKGWSGKKLIVSFAIKPNQNAPWEPGEKPYDTNDTQDNMSGLYGADGEPLAVLDNSPQVMITAYGVSYEYDETAPENAPAVPAAAAYLPGTEVTVADPVTLDGYIFSDWTPVNGESDDQVAPVDRKFTMPARDVVFTGSWTPNSETISFTKFVEGENAPETTFYFIATPILTPPANSSNVAVPAAAEFVVAEVAGPSIIVTPIETDGPKEGGYPGTITITGTAEEIAALRRTGFTVREDIPNEIPAGWDYDSTEYEVKYQVGTTEENSGWIVYEKGGEALADGIVFTNTYTAPVEPILEEKITFKKLVESETALGQDYVFHFKTAFDLGSDFPDDAGLTVTAGDITVDKADKFFEGTITITGTAAEIAALRESGFTVQEVIPETIPEDWDYDSRTFRAFWNDATSYSDAKWLFDVVATDENERNIFPIFLNKYTAPEDIEIPIVKTVEKGGNRNPAERTFTFELFDFGYGDYNENAPAVTGNTITTAATGETTLKLAVTSQEMLGNLSEGFYLREVDDRESGEEEWKYSDAVYYIEVNEDGKADIYATKKYETDNGTFYEWYGEPGDIKKAEFTNTYTKNGPITPSTDPDGTAVLIKVDANDNDTYLSGAKFELYKVTSNGSRFVRAYTTDRNGKISIGLDPGDYYWQEIVAPEGYTLDSTEHEFTIKRNSTTKVTIENSKTSVPDAFSTDHYAYVIGYANGFVRPEANITRAEVATIFFRLLSDEVRNANLTKTNSFSDVSDTAWYNTAVSTMTEMGIINGYPNGTFGPNNGITRAEFAAIAARFDKKGNTTDASFTDIYGHWAMKEISIAVNNGWVLGYEDDTFRPDRKITRAEAMAMVNRVLQRIPESTSDLESGMVTWLDNMDTTKWYYLTVQEATNSHYYERKTNGYEYWTELRPIRDWAAIERN